MNSIFDAALCLFLLLTAVRVVSEPLPRHAVTHYIAYGLLLALLWVRLDAVDVALTEAAVGSGLAGIVLLRAAAGEPALDNSHARTVRIVAAIVSAAVTAGLCAVVLSLPLPPPTLAGEVARGLPGTNLGNPVTAVLMVFRALDTVLETVVVLLALIGVWALVPETDRPTEPPLPLPNRGASPMIFLARVLVPFGLLFAAYQVWAGADTPGGKFQGAAVLAAMVLLLILSGLVAAPSRNSRRIQAMLLVGPFVFLAVGVAGFPLTGFFLGYPPGLEKPVIILVEVVSTISIATTLVMLALGPHRGSTPS
jgi:multisubunit Na+/H+ antiporter MnhB subunit